MNNKSSIPTCPVEVRSLSAHVRPADNPAWSGDRLSAIQERPLTVESLQVIASDEHADSHGVWSFGIDAALAGYDGERFQQEASFDADCGLTIELGAVRAPQGSMLCLYQHKEWWMRPCWAESYRQIPQRTQLLLWRSSGRYPDGCGEGYMWNAALAVCGQSLRADISGTENGFRVSVCSNVPGHTAMTDMVLVCASASEPYACIEACVKQGAQMQGIMLRDQRPFPRQCEGLGWCTWDSLGQEVNESDILLKMDEFRRQGIPLSWVLIDDGWSQVDRERKLLQGWHADRERFPEGLGHTVRILKQRYGVKYVGVWQAYQGYWNGVDPASGIAMEAKGFLQRMPNGCMVPGGEPQQSFGWWHAWDGYLRGAGVDFVKVDSQSSMSVMSRSLESYGATATGRHTGLDAAVAMHFHGALINCMGMAPEDYWHRPSSPIVRTSDDFLPREVSSLTEHVMQNVYVSAVMRELYHCDWDMFWTEHPHARTHALLRMMSAGPLYCSDALGHTCPDELRPLLAQDGFLPRCDAAGVPDVSDLIDDPRRHQGALIINSSVASVGVHAVIGLADGSQEHGHGSEPCLAAIRAQDEALWLYSWDSRAAVRLGPGEQMPVAVDYGEASLYLSVAQKDASRYGGIIPIGLVEKYLSPAFVTHVVRTEQGVCVELREPGTFAYLDPSQLTSRVTQGNTDRTFECNDVVVTVESDGSPLFIDFNRQ